MNTLTFVWIALMIAFLIVEACTVQLVSTWFAVGALVALIANLCSLSPAWQLCLFLVASAVCLIVTRPLVKRFTKMKFERTNADRCIGKEAIVIEEINNRLGKGQVKVDGNVWTARSENDTVIAEGQSVFVKRMEGVKLIVQNKE